MNKYKTKAMGALARAPLYWLNVALVVCLFAGLVKPMANDWFSRHPYNERSKIVAASGFFDFSSFMNALSGLIQTFADGLDTFIEAPLASFEKKSGATKEETQSGLNVDAAQQGQDAAAGAMDQVASDTPEACTIKQETQETVKTAEQTSVLARARTQYSVNRTLYNPSSLGATKELLTSSFGDYCSPENLARGSCTNGVSPKNMPDADITANTVMGNSDPLSNKMSQDEIDAAGKYVNWVSDPVPFENPPLALLKTPAGQRIALELRHRAAIAAASQFSLNRIIAARSAAQQ